jgi:chromosome segregation ATPase
MHADAAATHDAEQQRLERITSLESEVGRLQQALSQAEAEHAAQRLANERSVAESAEQLQQQIGSLQDEVARLHAALQAADAEQQAARLAAEQQAAEAARLAEQHAAQLSALQQESELLRLAQEEADQCRSEAERLAEQLRGEAEEARAEMHRAKVFADRIASTAEDEVREKVNALEDALADLAAKNEQLTHEIDGLKRKPAASVGSADSLTWEERKRLVLSQLEDEDQQDSEGRGVSERMSMRQLIEKTDREMARKEREISELQQLLEQQADTINHANQEVAVGAAAFAQIFDQDEIIRRERERLQSLQKEWEGKLREAEIDVSRERAKLSRERNELEEKQRDLQDQLRGVVREAEPNDGEPGANKSAQRGGRWFSKLGLNDRP